jgi:hypothetical protein
VEKIAVKGVLKPAGGQTLTIGYDDPQKPFVGLSGEMRF